MAAGFKTATVNASDVPATLTNFPSYVDLDRIGVTTLAEAQSIRVYADEAKTVEWAREIVSVDEMHVKVPSLTSTVDIYVDWDGVRSDYATTATYGRNAVWADYAGVWHMQENTGTTAADSAGNFDSTLSTSSLWSTDGVFGNGVEGASSEKISSSFSVSGFSEFTAQMWLKTPTSLSTFQVAQGQNGSSDYNWRIAAFSGALQADFNTTSNTYVPINLGGSTNTYHLVHMTWDGATFAGYRDGSSQGTSSSNNLRGNSIAHTILSRDSNTSNWQGVCDECRVSSTSLSANWITTEYNNQNDEATFWGTWTDAGGGGGGGAAQAARRGAVMMM